MFQNGILEGKRILVTGGGTGLGRSMADGCDWLTGQLIHMDGGQYPGTGGNFCALRDWSDAQWTQARASIEAQNAKDRAQRG